MLQERLLKLYKSSLNCKAKKSSQNRAVKKIQFFDLQNAIFFSPFFLHFDPSYFIYQCITFSFLLGSN